MVDFFADNFSECVILAVLLLAMFPMVESRVAIPLALSAVIWGDNVLSPVIAFFVALLGGMIPSIFIIWLVRKIKSKTSGFVHEKFLSAIQSKYHAKIDKVQSKTSTLKKCLTLVAFVSVPLPLTGVYSGSIIAGLTNLKFWQGFLSVLIGEIISCVIVLLVCILFGNSTYYIFLFSLALIAVFAVVGLLIFFFKKMIKRYTNKRNEEIELNTEN